MIISTVADSDIVISGTLPFPVYMIRSHLKREFPEARLFFMLRDRELHITVLDVDVDDVVDAINAFAWKQVTCC